MTKGTDAMGTTTVHARVALTGLAVLMVLPVTARSGTVRARFRPPAVYTEALTAVAPCLDSADAACIQRGFATFASGLAAEIEALPSGRAGLSGWLRFAAKLHQGRVPAVPVVQRVPIQDALMALYAEVGYQLSDQTRARMSRQLEQLSPAAASEVADLVSTFVESLRLAARARSHSGIERWMSDPRRADALATLAMRAPQEASPEAHEVLEAVSRVDIVSMTEASLVMADALTGFDEDVLDSTIDLPLVFIGGEGDTTHTHDRLLLIDESGDDTYLNNAGGGLVGFSAEYCLPMTDCLEFDYYPAGGSFAADLGPGNDRYDNEIGVQGWGFGAVGILFDEGGSDVYDIGARGGQGAGFGGIGALYDTGDGDDRYLTIFQQGTPVLTKGSGLAGIGLLVDEGGSDVFRQDGLDGVAYGAGGGLGLLASLGPGNDIVRSDEVPGRDNLGNPITPRTGAMQGYGELAGVGILYDEAGNDRYRCNGRIRQGCQGAAGGSSLGLLWDRGGNDRYLAEAPSSCDLVHDADCVIGVALDAVPFDAPSFGPLGQGASYLWLPPSGPALGVLYDESGNDEYVAPLWAQGYSSLGNLGLLYDTGGGSDVYDTREPLVGSRADGETWLDGLLGIGIDE